MGTIVRVIESISEWTGRVTSWFCLALVLALSYEVFMRYVLGSPTKYSYEVATMLGVSIATMGLAYTHLHDGHVRVDVFWKLLPPRGKALADLISSLLFFFPLIIVVIYISAERVQFSWSMDEKLTSTLWYPPAWPIRAVMVLGLFLFMSQGVAKLIHDIHILKGLEPKGLTKHD